MADPHATLRHRDIALGDATVHVVEAGVADAAPYLFLHGWPQSSRAWRQVMELGSHDAHVLAIDLPGVGSSTGVVGDGTKRSIASVVHALIAELDLHDTVLVGQDIGGMVTYAYLHEYDGLRAAVIMNVVIPGLDPYRHVIANPYLWHFAFHWVPELPELLIEGHQRAYFDYFFDLLSTRPETITQEARDEYAAAHQPRSALHAGIDWYRAFHADAADNQARRTEVDTPVLYLRGDKEMGGDIAQYVAGLESGGLRNVTAGIVSNSGHFTQEENPEDVWTRIARFAETV